MLDRKMKKRIAHFYGRDYDYWDDMIDNLFIPCAVSALTAFAITFWLLV